MKDNNFFNKSFFPVLEDSSQSTVLSLLLEDLIVLVHRRHGKQDSFKKEKKIRKKK